MRFSSAQFSLAPTPAPAQVLLARRSIREPVGAGGRLQAAYALAIQRAATRLIPMLVEANTRAYLHRMQQFAHSSGVDPPVQITDLVVHAGIMARARVSARSIATTQARRLATFLAADESRALAEAHFAVWHAKQKRLVAIYETACATAQAQRDFVSRNRLTGREWAAPSHALCVACTKAVAAGEVPLGTLPEMPLHIGCVHALVYRLDLPQDRTKLWFG